MQATKMQSRFSVDCCGGHMATGVVCCALPESSTFKLESMPGGSFWV